METTSEAIEFLTLSIIVVGLSIGGYLSMRPLVILASAFSWIIWGVFCYQHSTTSWDIEYGLFMFSILMFSLTLIEGALLIERRGESIDDTNPDAGDSEETDEDRELDDLRRRMRLRSVRQRDTRRYHELLRRARGEK